MICIVDQNNKIINIVNAPCPIKPNERVYYPWCSLWEQYTDVEPLWYAKQRKLYEVTQWTASSITGGFVSEASGEPVRYDSDKETQLTMQGIALNVETPLFAKMFAFLSCLCGSEPSCCNWMTFLAFLSCLCGSERV